MKVEIKLFMKPVSEFKSLENMPDEIDQDILRWFRDGSENHSIIFNGQLVGLFHLGTGYDESFHISTIYILRAFRNLGIGQLVIDYLKTKNKGNPITLSPYTDESAALFLRNGFEPNTGDLKEYYYLIFDPSKKIV